MELLQALSLPLAYVADRSTFYPLAVQSPVWVGCGALEVGDGFKEAMPPCRRGGRRERQGRRWFRGLTATLHLGLARSAVAARLPGQPQQTRERRGGRGEFSLRRARAEPASSSPNASPAGTASIDPTWAEVPHTVGATAFPSSWAPWRGSSAACSTCIRPATMRSAREGARRGRGGGEPLVLWDRPSATVVGARRASPGCLALVLARPAAD